MTSESLTTHVDNFFVKIDEYCLKLCLQIIFGVTRCFTSSSFNCVLHIIFKEEVAAWRLGGQVFRDDVVAKLVWQPGKRFLS